MSASAEQGLLVNGEQIIDGTGHWVGPPINANTPPPILMMNSAFPV